MTENEQILQTNYKSYTFHFEQVQYSDSLDKPSFCESSTLVEYKKQFILFGGLGLDTKSNHVHVYSMKNHKWKKIVTSGNIKPLNRFGHSATVFKNYMVVFGGGDIYNIKQRQRIVYNDLWFLNLDNFEWQLQRIQGESVDGRRNHASCLLGNKLFIHGGLSSYDKSIPDLNIINLEKFRSKKVEFDYDQIGICFHQLSHVFYKNKDNPLKKTQNNNKINIQIEGIYSFGGKLENNKIREGLMILKLDQKDNPIEWIRAKTLGKPPLSRYQHTQIYNYDLNCLIIHSGRNDELKQKDSVLSDIWVLQLNDLNWIEATLTGNLNKSRFSHAYAQVDQRIFIFGGASNIQFSDCGIYVLEMDQMVASKKNNLQRNNSLLRQTSLLRLNDANIENDEQIIIKNNKIEGFQSLKTFQPTPSKDQLKNHKTIQAIQSSIFEKVRQNNGKSCSIIQHFEQEQKNFRK